MLTRAVLPARTALRTCAAPAVYPRTRSLSQRTPKDSPGGSTSANTGLGGPDPDLLEHAGIPPQNFSKPTLSSLDFWWRFVKFSFIGATVLAGTTALALEGTHVWLEHRELAPESDPDGELARWGWLSEAERWSGGSGGGTDPALGWKGRHALRSAWAAQHWGSGAGVVRSGTIDRAQTGASAVEARLEYSHDFLNIALAVALERAKKDPTRLRPHTVTDILVRHAATLERIGSKGALYDARAEYERVWEASSGRSIDAARVALKLGDVCARLGDSDEAIDWWAQALSLASASDTTTDQPVPRSAVPGRGLDTRPLMPEHLPASPLAQRTLAATFSSLSAHYAQTGRLEDALIVQEAGVALLRSAVAPSSTDENLVSHAQALHMLFLHHRMDLLSLHRAEVNYALRSANATDTLAHLSVIAALAEHEVQHLAHGQQSARTPLQSSPYQPLPPQTSTSLAPEWTHSRTLQAPAHSLLRDARRTAMQAWTLTGVLLENAAAAAVADAEKQRGRWTVLGVGKSAKEVAGEGMGMEEEDARRAALGAYERALEWAGADAKEGAAEPGAGVLESEWRVLWQNYTRAREAAGGAAGQEQAKEKEKAGARKKP